MLSMLAETYNCCRAVAKKTFDKFLLIQQKICQSFYLFGARDSCATEVVKSSRDNMDVSSLPSLLTETVLSETSFFPTAIIIGTFETLCSLTL